MIFQIFPDLVSPAAPADIIRVIGNGQAGNRLQPFYKIVVILTILRIILNKAPVSAEDNLRACFIHDPFQVPDMLLHYACKTAGCPVDAALMV